MFLYGNVKIWSILLTPKTWSVCRLVKFVATFRSRRLGWLELVVISSEDVNFAWAKGWLGIFLHVTFHAVILIKVLSWFGRCLISRPPISFRSFARYADIICIVLAWSFFITFDLTSCFIAFQSAIFSSWIQSHQKSILSISLCWQKMVLLVWKMPASWSCIHLIALAILSACEKTSQFFLSSAFAFSCATQIW